MPKLLLAEDEEFSREMLARRLRRSGYQVTTVADGRDAISAAMRDRPDLILLDLEMPNMDGRSAMRVLKSDVRTFRIPIIILSGHTDPAEVAAALAAGCHAFQVKPVVLRYLIERIEAAIEDTAQKKQVAEPVQSG